MTLKKHLLSSLAHNQMYFRSRMTLVTRMPRFASYSTQQSSHETKPNKDLNASNTKPNTQQTVTTNNNNSSDSNTDPSIREYPTYPPNMDPKNAKRSVDQVIQEEEQLLHKKANKGPKEELSDDDIKKLAEERERLTEQLRNLNNLTPARKRKPFWYNIRWTLAFVVVTAIVVGIKMMMRRREEAMLVPLLEDDY